MVRDNTEEENFEWSGEVSLWYPESGVMKEVVVSYNLWENECDILNPRYNVGVSRLDKENVNIMGDINVWSRVWIEILKGLYDMCLWRVNYIAKWAEGIRCKYFFRLPWNYHGGTSSWYKKKRRHLFKGIEFRGIEGSARGPLKCLVWNSCEEAKLCRG